MRRFKNSTTSRYNSQRIVTDSPDVNGSTRRYKIKQLLTFSDIPCRSFRIVSRSMTESSDLKSDLSRGHVATLYNRIGTYFPLISWRFLLAASSPPSKQDIKVSGYVSLTEVQGHI